jgi:hypothetical protein
MTKQEAIAYFGTQAKLGAALGRNQSTVSVWKEIPAITQLRLEEITFGALRADSWIPRGYTSPPVECYTPPPVES